MESQPDRIRFMDRSADWNMYMEGQRRGMSGLETVVSSEGIADQAESLVRVCC